MFKLVLICLSPLLVNSYVHRSASYPICLSETNNACQEEMKKKNETLARISYYYPPLTDSLKNYTEQCRDVMECASGLECFKGKPQWEIFRTSCDDVGTRSYYFDTCIYQILKKIYSNDHNCTAGFSFENLFTADTIFKKEKQCVLNIGQRVCKTDDFNFLQNNYDELIELYTNNPTSGIDRWDHPSGKFYMMHCDVLRSDFVQKSVGIMVSSVNQENVNVKKLLEIAQITQKCTHKSPFVYGNSNYYNIWIKYAQTIVAVMTNVFKHRPTLSQYQCLTSLKSYDFFREVVQCMDAGNVKKCVWFFINLYCQEEIMADSKNQTVTWAPHKESNVPDVSFSMFKNNQRHKFVFTVSNN
ncbi:hypothetical protein CRE_11208 [Caenorhabditis remanei]|uniref:T20D4.11-like domain-containing protein n=1 Tax=Caenorhabditis remanei TaxID=31234 RepID=E3MQD3_CAERE|nr:hypothetical protein CRE_11208 [Caenorhabditis remanei]